MKNKSALGDDGITNETRENAYKIVNKDHSE